MNGSWPSPGLHSSSPMNSVQKASPFAMKRRLRLCAAATIFAMFAGCGPTMCTSGSPRLAARADVMVTLDGARHGCVVKLYSEAQGSTVPCAEVAPFLRDELRLKSGSIFDIDTIPTVKDEEIAAVGNKLKEAGYRFIGGRRVPF
jgi:hypothetical protein